ncbi:MAG TPA: FkbM family methyltransferase [Nevskiaceae bacterium]|nr:FkbM family methyltransferase [Nevskiaceae bacterium]
MSTSAAAPSAAIQKYVLNGIHIELPDAVSGPAVSAALANGKYEHKEAGALQKLLSPDDIYFEVGAGVGYLSTLAYKTINKPGHVFAYEANPSLIPVIQRTWELNGVSAVVENCVLGDGEGSVQFNVSNEFWASSATVATHKARKVEVRRRDFGAELAAARPSVLVMDIEGGERDLLLGRSLPLSIRKVVVEMHPQFIGPRTCSEIVKQMLHQGFTISFDLLKGPMFAFWR